MEPFSPPRVGVVEVRNKSYPQVNECYNVACDDRPAALRLHDGCSGPRMIERSLSSCPRCHVVPGCRRCPHRQQLTRPASTLGFHARRCALNLASYPRCSLVPRALSASRLCSVQYLPTAMRMQLGAGQLRLRAMLTTSCCHPRWLSGASVGNCAPV